MNSLAATSPPADFTRRNFGKCPLATLLLALAIIIPNAGMADPQSLNYSGEAPSEQMQLGMLPGSNAYIADLDFRYRLTGETSLKPLRVYNNSITTTIEFAKTPDGKAPTLLIDGTGKYLNATVKYAKNPDRLIVDGLFDSAALLYSGTKRGSITIERLVKTGAGSKGPIMPPPKMAVKPTTPESVAPLAAASPTVKSPAVKSFTAAPSQVVAVDVTHAGSALQSPPNNLQAGQGVAVHAMPVPLEAWSVSPADVTLRRALLKWTARAGWQLVWEASVDVPLNVNASFDGDFRSAVKRLFSSLSAADVNLTGLMYSGNHVLRVTESGRRAQ